ncbi:MAG: hypothetical protein HYR85_27190 [Planctomycetes bacterium]|jgi:hypothetical protein|nr:hypothetical protein [Planctomycetota bacterium]MBI3844293.1 hypothetical protein [Planctomycetota bacterium]
MKSEEPDKLSKVRGLIRKLGELADVLDDVSKKMRFAVEKQKINLESVGNCSKESSRLLSVLQKKLEGITEVSLSDMQISKAKELSRRLIDCSGDLRRPLKKMTFHEYVEFTCLDEYKKFRNMPAITRREIEDLDWTHLLLKLYNED